VGGPCTILMYTWRYGRVLSDSMTNEATTFAGPHKSRMRQYIIELAHRSQTISPYLTQARATTFGPPNIVGSHKIHIFTTNIPTFHSRYRRQVLITNEFHEFC
jgi:hypothetical protein